ncbi:helix-turn-helix domain-containing protein [Roseovarius sp.]|uniref:helix-turn-helix domain-containing protein n=1 Tax=Roseovarius sp. TaxID=1486281 RepID=UPI003451EB46
MGRDKRDERHEPQWTRWILRERELPAWKALSFPAREAYFHLRVRCFAEAKSKRNNNGEVFRSLRKLASDMGCSVKTAGAALADLQAKGWIVATEPWQRGVDGKGRAATFKLSMLPMPNAPATQEPTRWQDGNDFPVTVYENYRPKPRGVKRANLKIQNPPPHSGTPLCPSRAHLKAEKS